ncbi:hypothetical protein GGX14DRAFT_396092 [Mycena pura]|uniref:SMODS and SLOG-associating 2TM effector domain-containing protein n=1 Tax=Mycena pura TaxID=153505 RepID=A0AAD6VAZ5_9AGAR|nr:hypothetical protein GGX14DRAFT_396092 [Mycena pura]
MSTDQHLQSHGSEATSNHAPAANPYLIAIPSERAQDLLLTPLAASSDGVPTNDSQTSTRPLRDVSPILSRRSENVTALQPAMPGTTHPNVAVLPSTPAVFHTHSARRLAELDCVVPVAELKRPLKSLEERLRPTMNTAKAERDKYKLKANVTSYALNIAIGMQVVLGVLTTGLSAATSGKQTSVLTAVLGGFSTVVASYQARMLGSKQPELSIMLCKDLERFTRECEIFVLDFGHLTGSEHDAKLNGLRECFEDLMGGLNSERRLLSI